MKKMILISFMVAVSAVHGGVISFDDSAPMTLDLRTGARESTGDETLTYSSLWDGGEGATVTIAQDGAALVEGLTGEGERAWSVTRKGTYVLTHTTYTNGVAGKVETATFHVFGDVTDDSVLKTLFPDSFLYDGSAHIPTVTLKDMNSDPYLNVTAYAPGDVDGDGVLSQNDVVLIQLYNAYQALSDAMKEKFPSYNLTGAALAAADVNQDGIVNADDVTTLNGKFSGYELVEGSDYTLAYSDNVNVGTGKVTITGKGNYGGTAILEFTIAKATIGADGEPGSGTVPDGGKSKFDATYTYDGLPHTIDTNALAAVRIDGVVPSLAYSLNGIDGWQVEPFVFTNVCVTSVWYRMSVANYNDYIHEARLTITPKSIGDPTVAVAIDYDPDSGNPPQVSIADQAIFRWQFVMSYASGDVDGDGVLSDEDVDRIGQHLAYLEMDDSLKPFFEDYNLTGVALSAADYNGDGVVDEADADALEASFYTLVEGVDYTVSVSVNAGSNVVSVTGMGNYGDSICQGYKTATPFAPGDVTVSGYEAKYDGTAHGIGVAVADGIAGVSLRYARAVDGEFVAAAPTLTDVGSMTVWCEIAAPGYITQTNSTTVTITKRAVTLTSGDASKVYDGTPVTCGDVLIAGDGFVAGEGASYNFTGSQTAVGTSANTFTYTLNEGTKADNYEITTVNGTLTVTKATVGPGGGGSGGDEPGDGEVPTGGLSKFDATAMYDGEGHTIDTNALVAAFGAAMIGESAVEYVEDDGSGSGGPGAPAQPWGTVPVYTNVGEYVVWYRVTNPNYNDFIHAAKLTITNRPVTVTSADGSWTYDGQAHSNATVTAEGFVDGEGIVAGGFAEIVDVGTAANAFTYAFADGTLAENYAVTCVMGTLTVTKATVGPGGGGDDEPGDGEVPMGGESKFDATAMYDGEGHTIDTNALTAAFGAAVIGELAVEYAKDDGSGGNGGRGAPALPWGTVPVYTNAGEYVLWYRVSNPNYNDFIHAAKVTITNRPVTVASADGSWTYDGQAHSNATVTAEGFVDGEGIVASNFATITDVGSVVNAFDYMFADGTLAENYAVTCVTGTLTVVAAGMDGWTDEAKWSVTLSGDGAKYDGTEKTCEVTALAYDGFAIPTFTVTGNTATDAGDYTLTVTGTGNFSGSHTFPWSIVKRAVTLTSGSASKVYDSIALTNRTVSASGDGFAAGEGASCEYTGSQTNVGTSENTFTYTLNGGTKAGNYDITTVNGTLTVTPATLNPTDVFGGDAIETPLVCEKTFNGAAQPVEVVPDFDEPYQFLWALTEGNENAYSATPPTLRNVADGELTVFFKFVTANYEPYYGKVVFRIVPKTLTDEMVVLSDEAFYYDPGSTVKKPSVTVADTNALGEVISTANDYTVAYENATAAGAIPVTVTAKNNYTGTVTKTFPVLKRPVAPPVIGTKAYNGRTQKATVPVDDRWTVVKNDGGINVGEYEVVLRLTNTDDYRWKGVDEDESDWTGVFVIRKGANGPSREIKMDSWTYGETPSEPQGSPRNGTYTVSYRRVGADISTETTVRPELPGKYIARFWVAESENYAGYSNPNEIEFEIYPGEGYVRTHTETTPVPVPYMWLDPYLTKYGSGDYEAAGKAKGRNGVTLWESYVAGLDPEEPTSKFTAAIELLPNGTVKITWSPDLSNAEKPRTYTTLGKAKLTDKDWVPVTDANKPQMRFFKVKVEMK